MKKIFVLSIVLLLFAASSYAATTSAEGELDLSGNVGGDSFNPIGLSPKVVAYYLSNGTTETASQWFAISTLHPGGNTVYATAQDVNNVYSKGYTTGDDPTTYFADIPTDPQSASVWSDEGWSL